jgi:hypothetical protein
MNENAGEIASLKVSDDDGVKDIGQSDLRLANGSFGIGDLLVSAGLILPETLEGLLSLSTKMRMPVERVISMHSPVSERILDGAAKIAERVADGRLTAERGAQLLIEFTSDQEAKLDELGAEDEAKSRFSWSAKEQPVLDLLRKISAITEEQSTFARKKGVDTGLPPGWVLIRQNVINDKIASAVIDCQRVIEKGQLPSDVATSYLRSAHLNQMSYSQVLSEAGIGIAALKSEVSRCQLLVASGIVSNSELLACREIAVILRLDMEQLLYRFGMLDQAGYQFFLEIHRQMVDGLPMEKAIEALCRLQRQTPILAPCGERRKGGDFDQPDTISELLRESQIFSEEELNAAAEKAFRLNKPMLEVFADEGLLERGVGSALLGLQKLLTDRLISRQRAVMLLAYCADNKCDLTIALDDFGWLSPRALNSIAEAT